METPQVMKRLNSELPETLTGLMVLIFDLLTFALQLLKVTILINKYTTFLKTLHLAEILAPSKTTKVPIKFINSR